MVTTVSDVTPGDERPGDWISLAPFGFSKYEASPRAGTAWIRTSGPSAGSTTGDQLKVTLGTNGYPQVKPYNDQGKQETKTVHSLILLANVGPPPAGMQTRHLDNDPLDYRWAPGDTDEEVTAAGGNLRYGTGPEQRKDQEPRAPPSHPPPRSLRHPLRRHGRLRRPPLPALHATRRRPRRRHAPRPHAPSRRHPQTRLSQRGARPCAGPPVRRLQGDARAGPGPAAAAAPPRPWPVQARGQVTVRGESLWRLSYRADPRTRVLADRHYNRQKIGAAQFVPPGACLVLRTIDG